MRFLGIGDDCDLGSLYLRLLADGHEVKVSVANPLSAGTLAGMVEHVGDWRAWLAWVRAAGDDGVIVFENVSAGRGALQDELRRDGFNVIGGSAYGDRLENDRAFAQRTLSEMGLPVCGVFEFEDPAAAVAFIDQRPARYVLKFNGSDPGVATYVGRLADGRDVRAMLSLSGSDRAPQARSFILMEHVSGIEMGVGAYFDGERFLKPACLDWEHKRFFPDDLGELTGEMGTVVTYERTGHFFGLTLERMTGRLRDGGYCGYVNLNTIVNEQGIWPLEFTCRFGYPGFAILDPLQETSWADLFSALVTRSQSVFATRPGFSVGIVLTTPPFPNTRKEVAAQIGLPVFFDGLTAEDFRNLHYGEVGLREGVLVTSGCYGYPMVVTGTGPDIETARCNAYSLARRITIPNARYRNDIGKRLIADDYARVRTLGLLGAPDELD